MTATTQHAGEAFHRRSRLRLAATATVLIGLLAATAPPPPPAAAAKRAKPTALPAFGSCASLLSYARRNARRTGGRTGVPTRAGAVATQVLSAPPGAADMVGGPPTAALGMPAQREASASPSFSGTNVQEVGVDEPDIVKTDGRHVFAIADGRLHAIDVTGATPKLVGTLVLEGSGGHQLLIRGDRALVMSTSYGEPASGPAVDVAFTTSKVVLAEVDLSDPAAMRVRRTMSLDGALVDARLTEGTARVVVGSSPGHVQPAAISSAPVRRFVPRTTLRSRISGRTFRRSVAACREVRHPRDFSGLDLLTVLTIDIDKGLFDVDRDAIMAGAQTVYGSTTGLYVASQRYVAALEAGRSIPALARTEIHRFDASKSGETTYAASGSVAGFVLNQYSLSEHDGALRVASTEQPQWFDGRMTADSESFVTVLAQSGTSLARVGRVDGLGKGERIYAVRFVGDKGYVVTFRQVDPLYTLDLSRKTDPRVLGELKILGYSAYLHPISDDLLLGVGQDASAQGRTLGTQLSLFDVSDLSKPVRRAQAALGGNSSSTAEFDPHAFLFWKPADLAVIPLQIYAETGETFTGAVGFKIGASSLSEAGRIAHPSQGQGQSASRPPIGRSLVVGDRLYTLSYLGLAVNRLDTLAPLAFTEFPQPPEPPQPGPRPQPAVPRGR